MCSGRVNHGFLLKAFLKGADGVLVSGWHIGDCHYLEGKLSVQLDIELDSNQTISQAKVFVNQLKLDIKKIPDITNIDIHLEL